MLPPPGPPGTTSCSAADVEAFDADLCASSGPDRKQVGALALGGLPVTRVSSSASSLVGRHAPAAAHEQTLGGQVLLCLIG